MKCNICSRTDAVIRTCELKTARITNKAHVDCQGHSQYRPVSLDELNEAANHGDSMKAVIHCGNPEDGNVLEVNDHRIQQGGRGGDGYCKSHDSFDCIDNLSDEEKKATRNAEIKLPVKDELTAIIEGATATLGTINARECLAALNFLEEAKKAPWTHPPYEALKALLIKHGILSRQEASDPESQDGLRSVCLGFSDVIRVQAVACLGDTLRKHEEAQRELAGLQDSIRDTEKLYCMALLGEDVDVVQRVTSKYCRWRDDPSSTPEEVKEVMRQRGPGLSENPFPSEPEEVAP